MGLLGQGILQELLNGAYRKCVVSFSFKVAYFDHEQDTSGHVTQGACGNVSEHHCVGGTRMTKLTNGSHGSPPHPPLPLQLPPSYLYLPPPPTHMHAGAHMHTQGWKEAFPSK